MPTALLSVYHKEGIVDFARELVGLGWDLIASGGTCKKLREAGLAARDVADIVGGGPILGHRVVTLSREIHAGLLARPVEDAAEMAKLGLSYIDLVCVDLYPLAQEIAKAYATLASVIEQTDIGGPTMLRSGAKGNRIVVCDPRDRRTVLQWLKDGRPDNDTFIGKLAAKAESVVCGYALDSARYRSNGKYDGILGEKVAGCCYGENRWQSPADLFGTNRGSPLALDRFEVIQGSDPSYINWCDIDRLLHTVTHIAAAFDKNRGQVPMIAVGCKHGNPCGAGAAEESFYAVTSMALGHPLALFGGVVMTNFPVTALLAEALLTVGGNRVLDGVAAPSFEDGAAEVLKRKNDRCRLYQNQALADLSIDSLDQKPIVRRVRGGFLMQPNYTFVLDLNDPRLQKTGRETTVQEEDDLLLAWAIGSTSNSNTVTLVKNGALIGNGVGQQDRVSACKLAIQRAKESGHAVVGAVAYSDSFFPFPDAPQVLIDEQVAAILTSSGSINDQKIRDCCQSTKLWMIPDEHGRGFFAH